MFTLRAIESLLDEDEITVEEFVDQLFMAAIIKLRDAGIEPVTSEQKTKAMNSFISDLADRATEEDRCINCLTRINDDDYASQSSFVGYYGDQKAYETMVTGYVCHHCGYQDTY